MILASQLKREVQIQHCKGSIIHAKPEADGYAAVGGRVTKRKELKLS
jgi:hypothetical protein